MNIKDTCFGFVGLGLIGGSIARTIRRVSPDSRIIVYNRTFSVAQRALAEGTANIICREPDETFAQCDYIFLCMPVSYNAQYLRILEPLLKDNCIITDVGSVKTDIHYHVAALGLEKHFIGGHPMAGSDKTGYEHASDHLLDNAHYIITPTGMSSPDDIRDYENLIRMLGAIPIIMDYKTHDYAAAAISHIPHLTASGLIHLVMESGDNAPVMRTMASSGLRDTTRIASGSPAMWQQICLTNKEAVSELLNRYINILSGLREMIDNSDDTGIYRYLESAKNYRDSMFQEH